MTNITHPCGVFFCADSALPDEVVGVSARRLVAVLVPDVVQEAVLLHPNKLQAFSGTKQAAEHLKETVQLQFSN